MHRALPSFIRRLQRMLGLAAMLVAAAASTGCMALYVDTSLKDLHPEHVQKVANPKPVQMLFEFQTKGAPNAMATNHVKQQVTELTAKSGLFSKVSDTPVESGAVLHMTINNVPQTDDAFAKGFVAGLTFGAAGSTVTDGYICTINYMPGNGAPTLTKTVRHAIHATVGAQSAPPNAKQAAGFKEAVDTMVRQIVLNGLNELAADPAMTR